MPVVQDQNRILDANQGAVVIDIGNALSVSGNTDLANAGNVIAAAGSLAGGGSSPAQGSAVAAAFDLKSALVLTLAVVAGFFLIRMYG